MPVKRLRVLQTFTREPDEIVVQTTGDAIAGLKDNDYFPKPPADPATLEAKLTELRIPDTARSGKVQPSPASSAGPRG